jgi:hypothetical protein
MVVGGIVMSEATCRRQRSGGSELQSLSLQPIDEHKGDQALEFCHSVAGCWPWTACFPMIIEGDGLA